MKKTQSKSKVIRKNYPSTELEKLYGYDPKQIKNYIGHAVIDDKLHIVLKQKNISGEDINSYAHSRPNFCIFSDNFNGVPVINVVLERLNGVKDVSKGKKLLDY